MLPLPQALYLVPNPSTRHRQPGPQRRGCLMLSWLLQIILSRKETNRQQGINTPTTHTLGSDGKAENSFFHHEG